MYTKTTKFSKETPYSELRVGDSIILYASSMIRPGMDDGMRQGKIITLSSQISWNSMEAISEDGVYFRIFENDRVWVIKELRMQRGINLSYNLKPFFLYDYKTSEYFTNVITEDFSKSPISTYTFNSFTAASYALKGKFMNYRSLEVRMFE